MKLLPWKSWKDTVGEKQKCWKQDDRWINTNSEQKSCCTSPKRKHSAVLVKRQHTIFSCAKRQHLWTTNGWRNVNPYFGSPPCCLNMTLSVTKKEPEIKKWNEGTLSREKVTWWKKKCQSLFSFSSSPLLRGSTSCRCQVPTLSQTQAHHSMFNVRCDMCNVGYKIHLILSDSQARSGVSLWEHWWYSWLLSLSDGNIIIIDYFHCQMVI